MSGTLEALERLRKRRVVTEVQTAEGPVHVRGLSGKERVEYFNWVRSAAGSSDGAFILQDQHFVSIALCKEDGTPAYDSLEQAVEVVSDFCNDDVRMLTKEVMRLSGMELKATDDAEKK